MELNKTHRSALLFKLKEAQSHEKDNCIKAANLNQEEDLICLAEIEHYLAKERVRIITEALTENEIDY